MNLRNFVRFFSYRYHVIDTSWAQGTKHRMTKDPEPDHGKPCSFRLICNFVISLTESRCWSLEERNWSLWISYISQYSRLASALLKAWKFPLERLVFQTLMVGQVQSDAKNDFTKKRRKGSSQQIVTSQMISKIPNDIWNHDRRSDWHF